jgi:hypothetical protein
MLDQLIPAPRLLEVDCADLAAPAERVWELVRHGELARSPLIRALFAVRSLPEVLRGKHENASVRIDDLRSSPERPGFQVFFDDPPHEFAVGAIGKVWQPEIPFVHVLDGASYSAFDASGFVKVAWAVRVLPRGERDSRIEFEVRVDATDDESWRKFERYFRLIGPGSRFIRRSLLSWLERTLDTPEALENERPLAGDELVPDAGAQMTHGVTLKAPPERIWPWLVQMGCRRAGYYSYDLLDNGGVRSAREIHPELLELRVGEVIPATPEGDEGFEVLKVDPNRALLVGGLHDARELHQLPFFSPRPERYWHVTWAFVLEALDEATTRLHVRVRAAFPPTGRLHIAAIRPVHHFMQKAMLRHLAERVEGRLPRDDFHDVVAGLGGMAVMTAAFLSPFLRDARSHWGLSEALAARAYPGDDLVREPRWSWTHGIEIEAPAESVWPWISQLGADRGGFYSYQWLENLAGCNLRNAEVVHPEWQARVGGSIVLHPDPKAPRLQIVTLDRGKWLVSYARPDEVARAAGRPWVAASWLFFIEPLAEKRCRLVSRYRVQYSDDLATRLAVGPTLIEPVGFAMDRRMLLGLKKLVELAKQRPVLAAPAAP